LRPMVFGYFVWLFTDKGKYRGWGLALLFNFFPGVKARFQRF
jgi:hypothetical protein